MAWKPQVQTGTDPKWYSNALVFETETEALASARDLMSRWMLVTNCRAIESGDTVNRP